jgi:tetratricopeptide (TPR) repeat protein
MLRTTATRGVSRTFLLLAYALIIAMGLGLYHRSLSYGYTHCDDDIMIRNSIEFLSDPSNIPRAFTTDAWFRHRGIELYRPLQTVTYILDAQKGEDILFHLRLTNLLLHILCCIVVFHLLLRMKLTGNSALFGSMVYAAHYLFLHTVIWIPARGDLLLALFSFLSLLALIKGLESGTLGFYLLNLLFFALAIFSKETAILLPILFLLWLFLFSKRPFITPLRCAAAGGYAIVGIAYLTLRSESIATTTTSFSLASVLHNMPMIPETVAKFFLPLNFSTLPSFDPATTYTGLAILGLYAVFAFVRKDLFDRLSLFAAAWFFLLITPGLIYRPGFAVAAYDYLDHRSYLFCFGILLTLLTLLEKFRLASGRVFVGIFLSVLLYLTGANVYYGRSYKDSLAFSTLAIQTNPSSALAHFIHGNALFERGDYGGAMTDFDKVIAINPEHLEALYNRAILHQREGNYRDSLRDLDRVLLIKPDSDASVYHARGVARGWLERNGDPSDPDREARLAEAVNDLDRAVALDPQLGDALYNRASLNLFRNRYAEALGDLDRIVLIDPNAGASIYNARGIARAGLGDQTGAMADFDRALLIDPTFQEAEQNRRISGAALAATLSERRAPPPRDRP